ncbi:MAG: Calx-beta domain-containing protein [Pirellulales bacterium]
MFAALELSSLLAVNGGDGAAGFVAYGSQARDSSTIGEYISTGDINGDGYADYLISDSSFNAVDQKGGAKQEILEGGVFVVYGDANGMPAEIDLHRLDGSNGFVIHGNPDELSVGIELVASGGDMNGDEIDDIAIASSEGSGGRVYVVYGRSTGFPTRFSLRELLPTNGNDGSRGFVVDGVNPGDIARGFLASLAMDGDVNGDGVDDLLIGAAFASPNNDGTASGQAYAILGKSAAEANSRPAQFSLTELDGDNGFVVRGATPGARLGVSVSAGGDLNGDGIDDIVVGASRWSPDATRTEAGATFVIYGTPNFPSVLDVNQITSGDGSTGFIVHGANGNTETGLAGDRFGVSVFSGGDFNGDGLSDLAIGAPRAASDFGSAEVGEGYVIFGRDASVTPFPAIVEPSSLDGTNGFIIRGLNEGDHTGTEIALGDVNGDALADLIVTASGGDPDGRVDAGKVYVIFGIDTDVDDDGVVDNPIAGEFQLASLDGTKGFVIHGINAGDLLGSYDPSDWAGGHSLAIGDYNGDGVMDLALGTGHADETYMLFGGPNIIPPPPEPTFTISDAMVTEGNNGQVTAIFTVTRALNATGTDTVDFTTTDGSARAGVDYLANSGTLTFLPGVTSLTISVVVQGDTDQEADETFVVQLSNASNGASIADATGVGTIRDDDSISANTLYVYDIRFESKRNGKDWRAVFEIRSDSNADGIGSNSDAVAAGVTVTVTFAGRVYTGTTDSNGVFRTSWIST